jgi:hypothetical protein
LTATLLISNRRLARAQASARCLQFPLPLLKSSRPRFFPPNPSLSFTYLLLSVSLIVDCSALERKRKENGMRSARPFRRYRSCGFKSMRAHTFHRLLSKTLLPTTAMAPRTLPEAAVHKILAARHLATRKALRLLRV